MDLSKNKLKDSSSPSPLDSHLNRAHFKMLQSLLKKGYASQILLCSNVPPAIRIPALLACRMYDEVVIEILNAEEEVPPLHLLWMVISSYATGNDYEEYYQQLEEKHKQIADDWFRMNKPLSHPQEVKKLLRTKYEQLLLKAQEENYFTLPQMPVFIVSCAWLEKFYDDVFEYIPAVDSLDLIEPLQLIQNDPKNLHNNFKLKEDVRENVHFKIIPYEAWMFLKENFGGVEIRRFTTNEKEPICELWLKTVKVIIVENRYILNGVERHLQIQVSRFDTISTIIERIQKLLIGYELVGFDSLKGSDNKWQAIRLSNIESYEQLVDIIQQEQNEILSYTKKSQSSDQRYILERLEYKYDYEQAELNGKTDYLMISIEKKNRENKDQISSCIDIHSIPVKKIVTHRNQCLTCEKTEDITECTCKTVYFCCKECKAKNIAHQKVCKDLMKADNKLNNLFEFYGVRKRTYDFGNLKKFGKVGLENLGNTCYLNSALQCVLSLEVFNQYFVKNQHLKDVNTVNVLGTNGNLACAYGQFIKDYFTTNRRALQPTQILKIIAKNPQFRGYNHQDSQEFLNYFLDKLHEDLNQIKTKPYVENIQSDGRPDEIISEISWTNYLKRNKSFINQNLAGQYRSEIKCPDCQRISITFDPFMSVTLPFPRAEKNIEVTGYFLSREGEFRKVSKEVPATMNSAVFLKKYFHQPVFCLWLRNKAPNGGWNEQKSVYYNIKQKGVLLFYPRAPDQKVEIRVNFENYNIFHRRIFCENINSEEQLKNILYTLIKKPLLKARKSQQPQEMSNQEYLKLCNEQNFIKISSSTEGQEINYPLEEGVTEIRVKIMADLLKQLQIKDNIKFDVSAGPYEPLEKIKVRSINDQLAVSDLLESFTESEQLTEDNAWYCSKCKDHKLADKAMSIYRAPKNLILHLKRFNHRGNRYVIYGEKVKTPVNLSEKETINGVLYELIGVVNHFGSLTYGHYTATVKRESTWFECDDSSVRKRNPDGVNAYLLFYKKVEE